MKRFEAILLGLFLACWLVYLLAVVRVVSLAGSLTLTFYPYFSLAAAIGWGAGNLYVFRTRDREPATRRGLLAGYFLGPLGLLFLLRAMTPVEFQRGAPLVGLYAFCVFSIFFVVANWLKILGRRPPVR